MWPGEGEGAGAAREGRAGGRGTAGAPGGAVPAGRVARRWRGAAGERSPRLPSARGFSVGVPQIGRKGAMAPGRRWSDRSRGQVGCGERGRPLGCRTGACAVPAARPGASPPEAAAAGGEGGAGPELAAGGSPGSCERPCQAWG